MAEQSQALAGLRVMVAVARADGRIAEEEKRQITDALAELAPDLSPDEVFAERFDLDEEIAKIIEPDVQRATYRAALVLSMADGESHAEESKLLAKLREAFDIHDDGHSVVEVLEHKEPLAPVEKDEQKRESESKREVLGTAIMAGALGANPLPIVSFFTEVGVFYLQGRLVRNLAWYYGHEVSMKEVVAMMATTFGLGVARVMVVQLVKFVPVWGSVVGGAAAFTTTFALGEAVRRHFAAGGDFASLTRKEARRAYEEIKKGAAKEEYEAAKDEIAKKALEKRSEIEALARDARDGKLKDEEVANRIKGLE